MIKLGDILRNDENINNLSLDEQISIETYTYLAEFRMDMSNYYPYKSEGKGYYTFFDKQGYKHFDRLVKEHERWELKIRYFDPKDLNKPIYDRPKVYVDLDYDEKVFNTHIKVIIDEIIPYFFRHKMVPSEDKILFLPALDTSRYRLYRISLNRFLDKSKYTFSDHEKEKNTLFIRPVYGNTNS